MYRHMISIVSFFIFGLFFYYCFISPGDHASSVKRIQVVCTTTLIADAVARVGAKQVHVYSLMGPGVDPHLYRAKEHDVHALASAEIIFYNGLHLEGKMADIFAALSATKHTCAVTDALSLHQLRKTEIADIYDPHIWHDVSLWIQVIYYIAEHLSAVDPEHASDYAAHASDYARELGALHALLLEWAQSIPLEQRILITAHDAFGYFGKAYGFTVIGLQGVSTDAEVSISDIQQLADFIVEKKIPTIFIESSINKRSMYALQQAVESRCHTMTLGSSLYSDALGDASSLADDYNSMMQYNMKIICNGLSHPTAQKHKLSKEAHL